MKNIFLRQLMLLLLLSCVPDDDFEVPRAQEPEEVVLETNASINSLLGSLYQSSEEVDIITFEEDLIMEGYVVSSDEAANFYKELILQDAPENPSAGVAVQINQTSYYEMFDLGRKIYVKLKGLSVGELNGVVALGIANGKIVEPIPLPRIQEHLIRSSESVEIVPLAVKVGDFTDRLENLFIKLENVQFAPFYVNEANIYTFASGENDEFDGEREVISCEGDFPIILSTSTFASFKTLKLPQGSGSLQGILTRDFYDEFFTIYLNNSQDLNFKMRERCNPVILDCGNALSAGQKILFKEDFEGQKNNTPVSGNGWTNFVQEGSVAWEGFSASGANASLGTSVRVQTPGSGDYRTVSWLITPTIQFNSQLEEVLQFKTSTSFANGSMLEVLFSDDWDGDPEHVTTATWALLPSAYVARRTDHFGAWISSGLVSLACVEGQGHIAFRYTGSDLPYYNGIYELDEVLLTAR